MSIQRFEACGTESFLDGSWVKYDDHLADKQEALAAQHKEDMEFAEWYGENRFNEGQMQPFKNEHTFMKFRSIQDGYQHWLDKVKDDRKYL